MTHSWLLVQKLLKCQVFTFTCLTTDSNFTEVRFLQIKPYNKDIYDHKQCSKALLWQTVQSWELELLADATASWKQRRWRGISSALTVHPKKGRFERWDYRQMFRGVLWCTDTKTQSWTTASNPETALSAASGNKQTVVSGLLAAVMLCVLVSVHEGKPPKTFNHCLIF